MKSLALKILIGLFPLLLTSLSASAFVRHKVLCEVDQYSVRVTAENIPWGELKYIVFNYNTENTTIVDWGDYSEDSTYYYYDFILHSPPLDTVVEVAARKYADPKGNHKVWLTVRDFGSITYSKQCTIGVFKASYYF